MQDVYVLCLSNQFFFLFFVPKHRQYLIIQRSIIVFWVHTRDLYHSHLSLFNVKKIMWDRHVQIQVYVGATSTIAVYPWKIHKTVKHCHYRCFTRKIKKDWMIIGLSKFKKWTNLHEPKKLEPQTLKKSTSLFSVCNVLYILQSSPFA